MPVARMSLRTSIRFDGTPLSKKRQLRPTISCTSKRKSLKIRFPQQRWATTIININEVKKNYKLSYIFHPSEKLNPGPTLNHPEKKIGVHQVDHVFVQVLNLDHPRLVTISISRLHFQGR